MCGIAGLLGPPARADELTAVAESMAAAVDHRGPDDRVTWVDGAAGVALGHARLRIVDLTPTGRQPMVSPGGRYVITYNGEMYDHQATRAELERAGVRFAGRSDTEVLLASIERSGVAEALRRTDAMFALALWDRQERVLWLARDRLGEKPLYYAHSGGRLLFGSELKALWAVPGFAADIDPGAVSLYLRFGYVPAPLSIQRGVRKLPPGTVLAVRPGEAPGVPQPYWSLAEVAMAPRRPIGDDEAMEALDGALRRSVRGRLSADVPVGAFLSGGVDSTLVCAVAQDVSPATLRTFTVGFEGADYDESRFAAEIARRLGTDHTEVQLDAAEALAVVPRLPAMYDEPFADSSQIPTHLVSAIARRDVTVALSGDGGDELFAGYTRSRVPARVWPLARRVPASLRRSAAWTIDAVGADRWDRVAEGRFTPAMLRQSRLGTKMRKLARTLGAGDLGELYRRTIAICDDPAPLLRRPGDEPTLLLDRDGWPPLADLTELALYLEAVTYLPDDILAKVDRASMAVSLETRLPMLAPEMVELAWSLPMDLKVRDGVQKWLPKALLARYLPNSGVDRPKMGFGVPIGTWLRGPLRPWAEDLLAERPLADDGVLAPASVRQLWASHLAGRDGGEHLLWAILMYRAWTDEWVAGTRIGVR